MPTAVSNRRNASARGFGQKRKKTVVRPKWSTDVNTFVDVFGAVMRQTRAPRCAQVKYLRYLRKQLIFQGSGYMAKTRNYPIFGLRILGGDIKGSRTTQTFFVDEKLRPNSDGVMLPLFMSWYWNRLYQLSFIEKPTKTEATEVSRILAVLSFSKFIQVDSKRSRKRAENNYQSRVKGMTGLLRNEMVLDPFTEEGKSMREFLSSFGINRSGEEMRFDRRCYSLKALVGKPRFRPPVPPAYGQSHSLSSIASFGSSTEDIRRTPNRLVNCVQREYYDTEKYDGKLHVISEAGGKYRGICPYTSPYAHSINLYRRCREALLRLPWNCNYDQEAGHKVARRLTRLNKTVVSVDASNFTDTVDPTRAAVLAYHVGSSGAVHYHGMLRIKTFDGSIVKSDVPLMGWKGTFDLASLMLSHSYWLHRKMYGITGKNAAQTGDDFVGLGSLEFWKEVYGYYGFELSEEKTVVSKTVSIFCGEYFWKGLEITPIRFLFTGFSDSHRFIGKLISRTRSFIPRCNYSKATKRKIFKYLKNRIGDRYNGYLDFRLSSDLGGIPLNLSDPPALLPYLENNYLALRTALCNIPFEKDDRQVCIDEFSHLPLGIPYSFYGTETTLSPFTWPRKMKVIYRRRRRLVEKLISTNRADITSVLLYIYDNTLLRP